MLHIAQIQTESGTTVICTITDDGSLLVIHGDTFERKLVHKSCVKAMCVHGPFLGIVLNLGCSKPLLVELFEVSSRADTVPWLRKLCEVKICEGIESPIDELSVCFVGSNKTLLLAMDGEYLMMNFVESKEEKRHSYSHNLTKIYSTKDRCRTSKVLSVPAMKCGLLMDDELGICVDENGNPLGNTLRTDQAPKPIMGCCVCHNFVILLAVDGIYIMDLQSGSLHQRLQYPIPLSGPCFSSNVTSGGLACLVIDRSLWLIRMKNLRRRISDALRMSRPELAYKLMETNPNGGSWMKQFHVEAGLQFLNGVF